MPIFVGTIGCNKNVGDSGINSPNGCAVGGKIDPILKSCWSRWVLCGQSRLVKKELQIYAVGSKYIAVVSYYKLAIMCDINFPINGTYQNLSLSVVRSSRLSKPIAAKSKYLPKSCWKSSSAMFACTDIPADRKIGGMVYLSSWICRSCQEYMGARVNYRLPAGSVYFNGEKVPASKASMVSCAKLSMVVLRVSSKFRCWRACLENWIVAPCLMAWYTFSLRLSKILVGMKMPVQNWYQMSMINELINFKG